MSLGVSAGAVRPPPWRLMPLLLESAPPWRVTVWISLPAHFLHVEDDLAVVEQQHVAGLHVARQLLVVEADAGAVAQLAGGVEDEGVAGLERDLAVLELADADLGALQVGHDAHGAPDLAAGLAHQLRARLVVGRRCRARSSGARRPRRRASCARGRRGRSRRARAWRRSWCFASFRGFPCVVGLDATPCAARRCLSGGARLQHLAPRAGPCPRGTRGRRRRPWRCSRSGR